MHALSTNATRALAAAALAALAAEEGDARLQLPVLVEVDAVLLVEGDVDHAVVGGEHKEVAVTHGGVVTQAEGPQAAVAHFHGVYHIAEAVDGHEHGIGAATVRRDLRVTRTGVPLIRRSFRTVSVNRHRFPRAQQRIGADAERVGRALEGERHLVGIGAASRHVYRHAVRGGDVARIGDDRRRGFTGTPQVGGILGCRVERQQFVIAKGPVGPQVNVRDEGMEDVDRVELTAAVVGHVIGARFGNGEYIGACHGIFCKIPSICGGGVERHHQVVRGVFAKGQVHGPQVYAAAVYNGNRNGGDVFHPVPINFQRNSVGAGRRVNVGGAGDPVGGVRRQQRRAHEIPFNGIDIVDRVGNGEFHFLAGTGCIVSKIGQQGRGA